jgi:hypothetical protein
MSFGGKNMRREKGEKCKRKRVKGERKRKENGRKGKIKEKRKVEWENKCKIG